jgi:AraC family transcriptional activator of pobA
MAEIIPQWENAFSLIDPQINAEGVHLWPFEPTCPVDIRFYVYDNHQSIRMNRHDYFEIFYLQKGELIFRIQDRCFPMNDGDMVILSSTQYHTMQLPEQGTPPTRARAAALYFMPDAIWSSDAGGEGAEYLTPFLFQDENFPYLIPRDTGTPREIFELMRRIKTELPAETNRGRLTVRTYLKMILMLLVNHFANHRGTDESFRRKQQAIEQLRPLFDFLENHYRDPITIESAASVLCMSKSHFMRIFKQVTGQPFVNYLNHFRIAKAQALLATTELSVSEIGQEVGFSDQSYFGLIFRKFSQLTPLQYRRQYGSHPAPQSTGEPGELRS